jgi:hypothetical protein
MTPMPLKWPIAAVVVLAALAGPRPPLAAAAGDWTQWGGPHRNFMSDSTGLASSWPSGGPKKLWTRALGEGHSSILVEGGRLYTMFRPSGGLTSYVRRSQEEVIAALDAATGKTVWEYRYAAPTDGVDFSQGAGPHSTPLIVGNRLFATSTRRELFALDKTSGKLLWSHNFIKEYKAPEPGRGYTCSPIAHDNTIIVTLGGPNQAVAAFNQQTGALVWKAGAGDTSPASPILIDVDGQPQLVVFGGDIIAGMNPANGKTFWTRTHKTEWGLNISTPLWSPEDHLLFVSSAYGSGSRVLELENRLHELAHTDALTGIPTRNTLLDRFEAEVRATLDPEKAENAPRFELRRVLAAGDVRVVLHRVAVVAWIGEHPLAFAGQPANDLSAAL